MRDRRDETAPFEPIDRASRGPARPPATRERPQPPDAPRRRPGIRRVRRVLRTVDPFSVLKLSLFFYGCFLVLWLVFVALVYWMLDAMGVFRNIEEFARGLVLEIEISFVAVEKWAFLLGFTFAVLGSLVNAFLAFLYNVGSDLVGGMELTFAEREL